MSYFKSFFFFFFTIFLVVWSNVCSDQAKLLAGLDVSLAALRLPPFLPALLCDPAHTANAIAITLHWCWENDRLSADAVTFACNGLILELTSQAASSAGGFRYCVRSKMRVKHSLAKQ
jgi:hypothetical protein